MTKFLLDTNAYFEILKYIAGISTDQEIETIIRGNCYISRLTKIEIISVIGKYSRGQCRQIQTCDRLHEKSGEVCSERYLIAARKRWSSKKLHDWLKLEDEITTGKNPCINIKILAVNETVIDEAERFIQNALLHNFKSMDSIILGTAKAYSEEDNEMVVVTADKGLVAGMKKINYPFMSLASGKEASGYRFSS